MGVIVVVPSTWYPLYRGTTVRLTGGMPPVLNVLPLVVKLTTTVVNSDSCHQFDDSCSQFDD